MAINKIRVQPGAPSAQTGEWADFYINKDHGGLAYASTDTVIPARRMTHIVKVPLDGATIHAAAGGVVAWQIPAVSDIIVEKVIIDITTVATGAATLDIGYTATDATTTSDTMLDGIDANSAAAVFDSSNAALDSGANAKAQRGAAGKWITIDEKTGDATGLVANLYIYYTTI